MAPICHCEGASRPWRPEREARGSALGVQSREGTCSPYRPPLKRHAPIASVAAVSDRLVRGNSTARGHWCTSCFPDVSLRGRFAPVAISGRQLRFRREYPVIRLCTARLHPKGTSSRYALRAPRRFAPRNDNSGAVTILTEACFARQCAAGPGCPRPYSALSMSAQKFTNYSASLKYAARSCIRLSSNGEVRLPSSSMARNVDSGAAYSRSLKAFRPAPGVSCSSW